MYTSYKSQSSDSKNFRIPRVPILHEDTDKNNTNKHETCQNDGPASVFPSFEQAKKSDKLQ